MKKYLPIVVFLFVEVVVVAFILSTVGSLPANIASHFNKAGVANGFMSQQGYIVYILAFCVGLPAIIVLGISLALRFAQNSINIPNKEFWLSPQNKQETIQFLSGQIAWLGTLIAVFGGYLHWLLLKANSVQPAQLSDSLVFIDIGLLLAGIIVWGALLVMKFMRVPKA